ncbi:MAG: DNA alkylation repair protein [Bacteroidetes bacterium]|nr:DNA alkylation repair protein [Bacteroidota bacterium]
MHPYVTNIHNLLNKHRNDLDALPMKKYMREQFEFFGIKSEQRRDISKKYLNSNPLPEKKELQQIVKELWLLPERELQYFAIELLIKCKKLWTENDAAFFEYLIVHKSWWDTVDYLANQVVGPWLLKFPVHIQPVTESWNKSKNIWLQRMSILFQLKYKRQTDLELLSKYIENLANSKEFFVQKSNWMDTKGIFKNGSVICPKLCFKNPLMPLSKREALKVIERKKSDR